MERKKTIAILSGILVILIVIFLLLRSCTSDPQETGPTPLQETEEETPTPDKETPDETFDINNYSTPFIEANIQFSCEVIRNPDLATSEALMKQRLSQIYKEKGFPTDDDNKMILILQEYERDEETTNAIRKGTAECAAE